jgi:hypothetical protein
MFRFNRKYQPITDAFSGIAFLQESLGFYEIKFRNLIRCPLVMRPAKLLFLETSPLSNQLFSYVRLAFKKEVVSKRTSFRMSDVSPTRGLFNSNPERIVPVCLAITKVIRARVQVRLDKGRLNPCQFQQVLIHQPLI